MKIGIDIRELEKKKITGIGKYLNNFLKTSVKNNRSWKFTLFGNQNTHINLNAFNCKKVIVKEYITFLWDQIQLPFHLKKENIDIFLTPYFKAPVLCTCKLVIIINDLIPLLSKEYLGSKKIFTKFYFKTFIKASIAKADKIIAISDQTKKDIINQFNISENKVEVVYLNVDPIYSQTKFNSDRIEKKYGISGNFILYVGNFNPHKNVSTLIHAYSDLPEEIKQQYHLVIGGRKDSNCSELAKLVKVLRIDDNVTFPGFIQENELPAIYSASSLFVFPSLYEGFGLPPLEAMASGTPVIVSNAGSLPEVVSSAGILVNPKDIKGIRNEILNVLLDKKLSKKMKKMGLSRAKEFTPKKTADEILAVLKKTVCQPG